MYKTLAAAAAIALAPLAATAATSISGSGGTFDLDATESAYSYQGTTSFDANQTWSFVVQDVTRSVTGTLISFGAIATPTSVPSITFAGQSLGDGDSFTLNLSPSGSPMTSSSTWPADRNSCRCSSPSTATPPRSPCPPRCRWWRRAWARSR